MEIRKLNLVLIQIPITVVTLGLQVIQLKYSKTKTVWKLIQVNLCSTCGSTLEVCGDQISCFVNFQIECER